MVIKWLETGPLMVNCFIVGDESSREAMVFDPGGNADSILQVLEETGLNLKAIVNTHTHWDHVGANGELQQATGAPVLMHRAEVSQLESAGYGTRNPGGGPQKALNIQFIEEGDVLGVGSLAIQVLDLRGHSPGGLGFVWEGDVGQEGTPDKRNLVICGDALFAGSIGRTDFPGGDMDLLIRNVRNKVLSLPDDTIILPGHGPHTTVGMEKQTNPFFQ